MTTISEALELAATHRRAGRLEAAEKIYRRILAVEPDLLAAQVDLGNILQEGGRFEEALALNESAARLEPNSPAIRYNLGRALQALGRTDEAIGSYRKALELRPDLADAVFNLGCALQAQEKWAEAVECFRRGVELQPKAVDAWNSLGVALAVLGQSREAVECLRRAVALEPGSPTAHSNLLYAAMFSPDIEPVALYEEHRRWNRRHAEPLGRQIAPHANDRAPERRLRIGYVSPDFRWHPVGRFIEPLLASHDRAAVEVFCYSACRGPGDALTAGCQSHADTWRDVADLSDERLAAVVREDRIDILVDLSMHMSGNRLLVFARKPAPVQVTYLAYPGTTGLTAIDYRLTDPYLDPPQGDDRYYAETSIRLPETYWCYRPVDEAPPVGPLPASREDRVTFGCLNSLCKLTGAALECWSGLLRAVPKSRLLLHARPGPPRDQVGAFFGQHGVRAEQITFADRLPPEEYFRLYGEIDIGLDSFVYGGGTTTCDALWMGVPVVSLAGKSAVSRAGLSLLSNVGLPELVARNAHEYQQIALRLANDLPRLVDLRGTLRDRMGRSPLSDAARFARNVEAAYRTMWRIYLGDGS